MEGNPFTWPVTKSEISDCLGPFSGNLRFKLLGGEVENYVHQIMPGVGKYVPAWILKPWARRFGWSLVTSGSRT